MLRHKMSQQGISSSCNFRRANEANYRTSERNGASIWLSLMTWDIHFRTHLMIRCR